MESSYNISNDSSRSGMPLEAELMSDEEEFEDEYWIKNFVVNKQS